MTWHNGNIIALGLGLVFLLLSVLVLADPDMNRKAVGLARIASWHPNYDPSDYSNNYTFRTMVRYYNNGSNLTEPFFNATINFTRELELLGSNSTFQLGTRTVRVYEVNEWGVCINESNVANGTCTSISWSQT